MWRICHWVVSTGLLMGGYLRTLLLMLARTEIEYENVGNESEQFVQVVAISMTYIYSAPSTSMCSALTEQMSIDLGKRRKVERGGKYDP